ncbi:penicillin-binding protein activator LpoB [Aliifodinibius salipaludis]|uniref:Penicillin-binding protein activator LpoB n=1 Tax=Fodinibius salipaludis TaxID=2032627 RepID=A0A2A2GDT0_9BACT|nr:penicillin-binding protein activator LpoB [Aliifodinibius salipaludis]PAU95005.1 penicillin-binding protein activator LpoB [Aliifodinibius salipaludis]
MKKFAIVFLLCLIGIWGCSNTKNVSRVDSDQDINLSGRWNDSDSQLVSDEMISDALSRNWLTNYTEEHGRKPTIIVGTVKNKTSEHISAETFIKDMEREMLNSNKARIVQAGQAREELRKERDDQQDYASLSTMKKWGLERGADFILQGTINSITDSNKKQKLISYQVDLELTDLENNEKVWIGTKKIRKVVK